MNLICLGSFLLLILNYTRSERLTLYHRCARDLKFFSKILCFARPSIAGGPLGKSGPPTTPPLIRERCCGDAVPQNRLAAARVQSPSTPRLSRHAALCSSDPEVPGCPNRAEAAAICCPNSWHPGHCTRPIPLPKNNTVISICLAA